MFSFFFTLLRVCRMGRIRQERTGILPDIRLNKSGWVFYSSISALRDIRSEPKILPTGYLRQEFDIWDGYPVGYTKLSIHPDNRKPCNLISIADKKNINCYFPKINDDFFAVDLSVLLCVYFSK